MKSLADIISEEFDKVFSDKNPKFRRLKEQMDNVNPSGLCLLCREPCGKGHVICIKCYAENKMK